MEVLGLLLIVLSAWLTREVVTGRATNVLTDTRDLGSAIISGDMKGVSSVVDRAKTGDVSSVGFDTSTSSASGTENVSTTHESVTGGSLISHAQVLAKAAGNRYIWGAEGPNSYDCSGFVWRTLYDLGIYKGNRFTTTDFESVAPKFAYRVGKAEAAHDDIIVWPGHHMGFVLGDGLMYSALNHSLGITTSHIASEGGSPHYWRIGSKQDTGTVSV